MKPPIAVKAAASPASIPGEEMSLSVVFGALLADGGGCWMLLLFRGEVSIGGSCCAAGGD